MLSGIFWRLNCGEKGRIMRSMETTATKKRGLAAIFALCPKRHALLLISAGLIALHLLTRGNHALMVFLSDKLVRPLHRALGSLSARVPFSMAELLLGVFAAAVLALYPFLPRWGEFGAGQPLKATGARAALLRVSRQAA